MARNKVETGIFRPVEKVEKQMPIERTGLGPAWLGGETSPILARWFLQRVAKAAAWVERLANGRVTELTDDINKRRGL